MRRYVQGGEALSGLNVKERRMSVTIDGPADFPALYQSADRESVRAQRSYLTSLTCASALFSSQPSAVLSR
jgi:hypothetical protein